MTSRLALPLSLVAAVLASCSNGSPPTSAKQSPPSLVAAESVRRQPFAVGYRASGTVRGHLTATLTSKGVGQVRAVHVRSGDLVREGQLLVELESNDVRAGVSRARAALSSASAARLEADSAVTAAKASAKLAGTSYGRSRKLFDQGAISRQEFDEAEARKSSTEAEERVALARVAAAESSIHEARAALSEAEAQLGYTKLAAPFSGRVLQRLVDPGALASSGTPLLVLSDDKALRVEAVVPESHGREIRLGGSASIELEGAARPIAGKIGEVVASVDPGSRTFLVKVDVPEGTANVRSGSFARVMFPTGSELRLVVPTAAVTRFGATERVFVLERGEAALRMVTTGERQAAWTTVLSGLSEGERVVVAPPAGLRDRDRVEVEP